MAGSSLRVRRSVSADFEAAGRPSVKPIVSLFGAPSVRNRMTSPGERYRRLVGQPLIAVTSDGIAWSRVPGDPALEDLRPVDLVVTGLGRAILVAEGAGSGFSVFEADARTLGIGAQP